VPVIPQISPHRCLGFPPSSKLSLTTTMVSRDEMYLSVSVFSTLCSAM
jgi:hypothetical protein